MEGKYLPEEDWERMFKMKRALEAAFVTAKIQEAAGSSEIRRVAETPTNLAGNRQQRRAAARKARP